MGREVNEFGAQVRKVGAAGRDKKNIKERPLVVVVEGSVQNM